MQRRFAIRRKAYQYLGFVSILLLTGCFELSKTKLFIAQGDSDTFTAVLVDYTPTDPVFLNIVSSAPDRMTTSTTQLTFTNANWNIPQTVRVRNIGGGSDATITVFIDPASDAGFVNNTEGPQTIRVTLAPNMQVRNGDNLDAEVLTSNALESYQYGTFKRNESVTLDYLLRNTGLDGLLIEDITLPDFMSIEEPPIINVLDRFESTGLSVSVDTSQAGSLSGNITIANNGGNSNELPFVIPVSLQVDNSPANALQILPGVELDDQSVDTGQRDVAISSFRFLVPESSVAVNANSISLQVDNPAVLSDVKQLRLYIDGGTRGIQDNRDVLLSILDTPEQSQTITFDFDERTFNPQLPTWFLVVADF
jgi:hypothetical protein